MLFKNPSVLYALFALLIPILIHLFKLRKFKKTAFTNVALLEKIKLQTRKSSQLKKWLVLFSRLLLFAGLIFAFTRPYLPSESTKKQPETYVIYLDNSFSMQAKGENGPLLKRAIQELIEQIDENQKISLFTNTEVYKNTTIAEIQNELLDIDYVAEQLNPEEIILKAKQLSKNKNVDFVMISDFQKRQNFDYSKLPKSISKIKMLPQEVNNVSIDSAWTEVKNNDFLLNIKVSGNNKPGYIPLSIFNEEKNLIGKAQVNLSETNSQQISVPLSQNQSINGQIQITSSGLQYDDSYYFSTNKLPKTSTLAIGNANDDFLKRIYIEEEFNYKSNTLNGLNYADIGTATLIILNEVEEISSALSQNLIAFHKQGGVITIIPPLKPSNSLEKFLQKNFQIQLSNPTETEKKVTEITFDHPLFSKVFTKKITNFQYPSSKTTYSISNGQKVLKLEDNASFLAEKNNVFVFASPLNSAISNFKRSPLVVPVFYNMAKLNTSNSQISYTVGAPNKINITIAQQSQDNVLELKGKSEEFIPLQQIFKNYVTINTSNLPENAGNYIVYNKNNRLHNISYNYPTDESILEYAQIFNEGENDINTSVTSYFTNAKAAFKIKELWKWFLIFALVFLLIEILLLKFLK